MSERENCAHCGGPKSVRNPTGKCDHLFWPENLAAEARAANGLEPARARRYHELADLSFAKADMVGGELAEWIRGDAASLKEAAVEIDTLRNLLRDAPCVVIDRSAAAARDEKTMLQYADDLAAWAPKAKAALER